MEAIDTYRWQISLSEKVKAIGKAQNQKIIPTKNYCGVKDEVIELVSRLRVILCSKIYGERESDLDSRKKREQHAFDYLKVVLEYFIDDSKKIIQIVKEFEQKLPAIEASLRTDIEAAYRGDPAAESYDEIMLAYPSYEVMTVHRMAHELYQMNVPILPRVMAEFAHSKTGIDIHPGAKIGDSFFIDHGTGVVIGETAVIGKNVVIYQGVTLGAKSFLKDEAGKLVKGGQRHPKIGNHVIIYAGATILGGDTTIGDHSVIGGNVWLTHSVEENQFVYAPHVEVRQKENK